jgi:dTDP-4-amino-4,6-dideoxygalactose transaminase
MKLCNEKGAYVVEDAAQAAGALFENRKIGTIGDVGVLSLGRGKNICALGGGVILTDKEPIARLIDQVIGKYSRPSLFSHLRPFSTGLGLSLFLRPGSYTIPAHLPFLNLGANIFDPNFEITRLPNLNAGVGQKTFSNLDRLNETRIQNARLLKNNLTTNGTIRIPKANPDGKSIYLRFPILFKNREIRDQACQLLNQKRLGASLSYPAPLNQIAHFRKYLSNDGNFPGAQFVSDTILTLPTHPFVTAADIEQIVATINQLVSGK